MNTTSQLSAAYQKDTPNYRQIRDAAPSSIQPAYTRISMPDSIWFQTLQDRFDELTSLPSGWDGYNGEPVSFSCAQFAANLIERLSVNSVEKPHIPAPQLVPGSDGTLQLEWHLNNFDLEVDVLAPYDVIATRFDHMTNHEEEIEVQADFTELADWVDALGHDRNAHQHVEI